MMRRQQQRDQQSRVFYDLSALVLNLLRSPPFPDQAPAASSSSRRRLPLEKISPTGFAWLLLGMSVTLMVCGSVAFFIGFMLMPWVLGLVMVFYVAGIVSMISLFCRSLLCYVMPPPPPRKEIPAWKFL
ncbi:hypothetical protein K2173_005805 [Erythroxylum novogranatense]|uniref:Uncharacterized protein n=1 Tax=Erythroxylum novogranatense TaxID=1862640 RepID=A0AAV8U5V7_9ROSI|nr:hypothetical protein K2173_005805 [Erythroxylum novogranatense]